MQLHANAVTLDGAGLLLTEKHVAFVHTLGPVLNVSPPNFGGSNSGVPSNWAWTYIETSAPSVDPNDGPLVQFPFGGYTQQSNSLRYEKILQVGECITLYGQWWAVIYDEGVTTFVLHGGFNLSEKLFRNAAGF